MGDYRLWARFMCKYELWVSKNCGGGGHTDKKKYRHINTMTRPALRAGLSENLLVLLYYFLVLSGQSSPLCLYKLVLLRLLDNIGKYSPAAKAIRRINFFQYCSLGESHNSSNFLEIGDACFMTRVMIHSEI